MLNEGLNALVARMLDLIKDIDSISVVGSDSLRMLKKTGLIVFAKRVRQQLCMMKHNCIRKVV